jgi:hypothetical protein
VRGRFHKLRLAGSPPHPDLLPAHGEKEFACARGTCSEFDIEPAYAVATAAAPQSRAAIESSTI